jgi:DNA-binding Lrp family transcriptional regulator
VQELTISELIAIVERVLQDRPPEDGMTTRELAEAMGLSSWKVYDVVRRLVAEGYAEPAKVVRYDLWGNPHKVPGIKVRTDRKGIANEPQKQ